MYQPVACDYRAQSNRQPQFFFFFSSSCFFLQSLVSFRLHLPLRPPTQASPLLTHDRPRGTPEHRSRWLPRRSMLHPAPGIRDKARRHGTPTKNITRRYTNKQKREQCGQGLANGSSVTSSARYGTATHRYPTLVDLIIRLRRAQILTRQAKDCGSQWSKGRPLVVRVHGRSTLGHAIGLA